MKKIILFFMIIGSAIGMKSQNCQFLCNGDFENPSFGHWQDIPDTLFDCWKTTESDSIIEVWWTGFQGVPAYHGNQFVELNANDVGTLFQNFLIAPGTQVTINFAHRGRAGVDTMSVSIGPVGGPYTTIGKYADGNVSWGYYTAHYTIPLSHGNYYSLRFNAIYAVGGPTIGNFLDDISVSIYPQLSTSVATTNVSCNNQASGRAIVSVFSGLSPYTYQWSPIGGTKDTATGLSAGVYTCLITDANGCSTIDTVSISQGAALKCTISPNVKPICNGSNTDSAKAKVTGGMSPYTYNWSDGKTTAIIGNVSAGTYTVSVKDSGGCTATASITLTQPTVLSSSIPSSINILCNGDNTGKASVSASGGASPYTYVWSNGQTTAAISNLSAGTYTVLVVSANGCTSTDTVTITQPTVLTSGVPRSTNVSCYGGNTGSATAGAVGGGVSPYTYTWSPGGKTNATISNLSAGTYRVTMNDANGCTSIDSVTVTQPPKLVCKTTVNNIDCGSDSSGSAIVSGKGGSSPYTYLWSNGQTTTTISGLRVGQYMVTMTDANGCLDTASATVVDQPPGLFACCSKTIIVGGADTILADSSVHYQWSPNVGLNCDTCRVVIATPTVTTTYTVVGTDANGCTLERIITVTVKSGCMDFIVPNVFTPNNDDVNDQFVIKTENMDKYSIDIYDRWGIEVYNSTDPTAYWKGLTKGGGKAPEGVYYYIIKATCQENAYAKNGFVQLIR